MTAISSSLNKLGTSPLFNMLLISSKKLSWIICVSEKRKACFLSLTPFSVTPPLFFNILAISFKNISVLYPLIICNVFISCFKANTTNLVNDCLPEPPKPINKALPRAKDNIRAIRQK